MIIRGEAEEKVIERAKALEELLDPAFFDVVISHGYIEIHEKGTTHPSHYNYLEFAFNEKTGKIDEITYTDYEQMEHTI